MSHSANGRKPSPPCSSSGETGRVTKRENHENALREAKQHIHDVVRNDWTYDPPATLFHPRLLNFQRTVTSSFSKDRVAPTLDSNSGTTAIEQEVSDSSSSHHDGGGPSTVMTSKETVPHQESRTSMLSNIPEETGQRQLQDQNQEKKLPTAKDLRKQLQMLRLQYSSSPTIVPSKCLGLETCAKVLKWRVRDYASSDSEIEDDDMISPTVLTDPSSREHPQHNDNSNEQSSKDAIECGNTLYGQDDLGAVVADHSRLCERRNRRRMKQKEEMAINPGLRFWVERRDVWTGARKKPEIRAELRKERKLNRERSAMATPTIHTLDVNSTATAALIDSNNIGENDADDYCEDQAKIMEKQSRMRNDYFDEISDSSSLSSIPSPSELFPTLSAVVGSDEDGDRGDGEMERQPLDPLLEMTSDLLPDDDTYDSDESLVPIVEPLLPEDNMIRASITPAVYPSIYTKVIIQGLTPTIPINLADVIRASVEGWKIDNQWPPKPREPQSPAAGGDFSARRRAFSRASAVFAKDSHKTTKDHNRDIYNQNHLDVRIQNNNHNSSSNQQLQHSTPLPDTATSRPTAPNSRRKSSIGHSHGSSSVVAGAVKKVLSGIQNHSFHLRRLSHGGSADVPVEAASNSNANPATTVFGSTIGSQQTVTEISVDEDH